MRRKIIGVTVGTPISPDSVYQKIKPVKTVNGVAPDENGNVEVKASGGDALKGIASGEVVALKDVSPIEHNLKVEISGVDNPEAVKITTMGANLFDVSKTKDNSGNDYETYDAATNTIIAHGNNHAAWDALGILTPLLPAGTYTMFKGNGYRSELCAFSVNNAVIGKFTNYNYNQKITFTVGEPFYLTIKYILGASSYPCSASAKDFMLLAGDVSEAEYEPYKEPTEYAYGEEIKSIYPSTTLMTDTAGAIMTVEYNKDANKVVKSLEDRISALEAMIVSQ